MIKLKKNQNLRGEKEQKIKRSVREKGNITRCRIAKQVNEQ